MTALRKAWLRRPSTGGRAVPFGLAAAVLAASLSYFGCSHGAATKPSLVVWIGIDTLRADALGCYGSTVRGTAGRGTSPNLDALAARGVRFENSYASAPWTIPALGTQMTGKWPWDHGGLRLMRPLGLGHQTLAECFQDAGWSTAGVMTNYVAKAAVNFDQGYDLWDDSLAVGAMGNTGHQAATRLLEFADALLREDPGEGLFLFLFLFDPHYFYEPHPEYGFEVDGVTVANYSGVLDGDEQLAELRDRRDELGPEDIAYLRARYDGDVAAADEAVGQFLRGLEQRGLRKNAVIVFAADHGEEIMDRGWIGHTNGLYDEMIQVPFIVDTPALPAARRGTVIETPISQIDFFATMLDLAGLETRANSLVPTIVDGAKPGRRYLYMHTDFEPPDAKAHEKRAHLWGVVDAERNLKWIVDHNVKADERPYTFLYDLNQDPDEMDNLAGDMQQLKRVEDLMNIWGLVPVPLGEHHGNSVIEIPGKGIKPNGLDFPPQPR